MAYTNPFADMMKNFGEFKAPSVGTFDVNHLMNVGRKNAEAYTAVGQMMFENCQSISRRQAELARAQVEKSLKTAKEMLVDGSPEINTTKQVALAKSMFESSFNNLREVYELATKQNLEALDKLSRRASESIEELTATATATTGKRKAA
jgi:phasin family protein